MKKPAILLLGLLLPSLVIGAIGCGGAEKSTSELTSSEIAAVLYENLEAANNEDLAGYMATIDEESPLYTQTEELMQDIFDRYDLEWELLSVEVIEESENEAKVEVIQTTKKVNGPEFRDNKGVFLNYLRKSHGKWVIFRTDIRSIEYLD